MLLTFGCIAGYADGQQIQVRIVRADEMRPATLGGTSIFRLLGRVALQHDSATMWCDSAHIDQVANTFDAYGAVRIHSKELRISGHTLYYDGNSGKGRILGSPVVLRDTVQEATLWSDELFFDSKENTAEYAQWGRIRSGKNEMESSKGLYAGDAKLATVWRSVTFRGEKVTAYTDSLRYHHVEEIAHFWGPTRLYEAARMAYGLRGRYDQKSDELEVYNEAFAVEGENQLFADYLYANKQREYLEANGRVVLIDSTGLNRLYAQRLRYWHASQLAVADTAPLLFAIDTTASARDTLAVCADTVRAWRVVQGRTFRIPLSPSPRAQALTGQQIDDSISAPDTLAVCADTTKALQVGKVNALPIPSLFGAETLAHEGGALAGNASKHSFAMPVSQTDTMVWVEVRSDTIYYARLVGRVRAFRRDVQMVADTMYVSGLDSSITVVRKPYPFLWSDSMQASALRMVAYVGAGQLDSMLLSERAIVALQGSAGGYDQIGADEMRGYFSRSELRTAVAKGDARMIYYMVDGGRVEGINKVECPDFTARLEGNKPVGVTFFGNPKSSMLPLREAVEEDRLLYGFAWQAKLRPDGLSSVVPAWIDDYDYYLPVQRAAVGYRKVEQAKLAYPIEIPRGISRPEDFDGQEEEASRDMNSLVGIEGLRGE